MKSLKLVLASIILGAGCSRGIEPLQFQLVRLDSGRVGAITTVLDPQTHTIYWSWVAMRDSLPDVYLARMGPNDTVPSAPVRVNHRRGEGSLHAQAPPQVRVDPDGTVYVLWSNRIPIPERRFPASNLYLARSTDGGNTFEPARPVNDDFGGVPSSHTFHDLAIGPDGTLYVSWIDARRSDARHANSHAPHGAVGPDLRVARSTDGGQTFTNIVVDTTSCPCCRTALGVDLRGSVYVAWRKVLPESVRDIFVAVSQDAARIFTEPLRVATDNWVLNGCPHAGPALALDDRGQLHVAWYTGTPEHAGIWYRRFNAQLAPETAPWPLAQAVPVAQTRLAWDGQRLWVAWEDPPRGRIRLLAVEQNALPDTTQALSFGGQHPSLAAHNGWVVLALETKDEVRAYIRRPNP